MDIQDYYSKALSAVADVAGVTVEDIKGKRRLRHLVDARCLVVMLMWEAGFSIKEISYQVEASVRWIQMIVKNFDDRVRYSGDDKLRSNWEETAKQLLSYYDTTK